MGFGFLLSLPTTLLGIGVAMILEVFLTSIALRRVDSEAKAHMLPVLVMSLNLGAPSALRWNTDRILSPKYTIFVSFNEAQEEFVEDLCVDLWRRERVPWFDNPNLSLSLLDLGGFRGHDRHLDLKDCGIVVVVVSEEYFTSSQQLLELHTIMEASVKNKNLKILPLFFGLNVDEFRNRQNEWFKRWEKLSMFKKIEWSVSLKLILDSNGLVYNRDSSLEGLVAYQKEIVSNICKVIPPAMSYIDELRFQERSKLCKVVRQHFENIPYSTKDSGVHVMGLYGMTRIGKTLLCQGMCHELDGEFDGKVCYLRLDNQSDHLPMLVLNKVLATLTTMPRIFRETGKEECRNILFNDMIWKQKTFLAIDNVWNDSNSLEQAKMFLQAPFVEGSWVIVTSRSKKTLRSLNIDENACFEMLEFDNDGSEFSKWEWKLSEGNSGSSCECAECMDADVFSLPSIYEDMRRHFVLKGAFQLRPECSTRIQSHSQSSPKTQQGFTFKPDKNKKASLSLQVRTESVEPLSEGMTSDVTMSVEELESMPQMIQRMDIDHGPTSCNEGSKESSSPVLSSFCEELHRLTISLSLRKVRTPREQSANLTLEQFLDNHHLHNPGAMFIAGRVQVSNRPSVQFVFKDGEEMAQVVGVGCFGQHAVVNITKSLKVQVVHDEEAWHQIWKEAIIGESSSQLMIFLKNSGSQSTVDDVTTLGNLSGPRLAKQFGIGLECHSHLQSYVKVHNQGKGRREFLILIFARYLLLDTILETKCHDDYVKAFEQNFPFCEESNTLSKSANLPDGVSSGEWRWTSTLWENLWNYLPSLVNNVGNMQLGTGREGIGDGGHGHGGDGGDGGDGGRDRDDSSGGDGVLPLPSPDLDLENDGFAIVEVHPGYGGRWDNKDLLDKDLQGSTITPILTFRFEKSKQRRELNVVLCVTFDIGDEVGPKPRDKEELRFGWFHDNLRMSLQSSDDDAAFLKPDRQVVDETDNSTTTSSTSSSITSNPFHVSFEAPGCSRSSPSSFVGLMGTLGISKDFKSRNTQVMEMTSQLIHKQVLGGFHYQDRSTGNKNSKLAFRYVFPSIPKDRVIHDDTIREKYMLSGLSTTISPTVRGTWHRLNMSEASPYAFHSSRTFYEILASKKKGLLKDCKKFEQTYDLKLYINHAMTHIYEYIGKRNILEGPDKSCHLLDVGSAQEE